MALAWYGTTAGSDSGSLYASATSFVQGNFLLGGIRFYAVSARTYTVKVAGVTVASVASPGGRIEEALFDPVSVVSGAPVSIAPDTPSQVRYTSAGSYTYTSGIVQGPWVENASWRLPWELLLEPRHVSEWEVAGLGFVTGQPHAMPGVVVNGATGGGGAPSPTSGRGYPRGRR